MENTVLITYSSLNIYKHSSLFIELGSWNSIVHFNINDVTIIRLIFLNYIEWHEILLHKNGFILNVHIYDNSKFLVLPQFK